MKRHGPLSVALRYRPWRLRHVRLVARDAFFPLRNAEADHLRHLRAAIDWLCMAQDVRSGKPDSGGVSAGWSFEDGWLPGYPETSGYIVETFLAAAEVLSRPDLRERAHRIIDWELSIQHADGAFPGHFGESGSTPVIFNTGQIMHGMLAGHAQLGRSECLDAAARAGDWLRRHQEPDGSWRRYEHNGVPHTYNTRATWALLATALISGDGRLKAAALRNLDWALRQQRESGWFANNAFTAERAPFTHTIAYAIRGFLECGVLAGREAYVDAAVRAARALALRQKPDGWLAGAFGTDWSSPAGYCCLTGNAQMSINWMRIGQEARTDEFLPAARRAIGFVKRAQRLDGADPVVRGAVAGSVPIWGAYSRFEFPNWAAKFFADALMMDDAGIRVPPQHPAIARARECASHA
jgi:hypothetical protein